MKRWIWILVGLLCAAIVVLLTFVPLAPCVSCQERRLYRNDADCHACGGRKCVPYIDRWLNPEGRWP